MDAQKVDMFIMSNSKFFESHQIHFIREKLLAADDAQWPMLSTIQFKDPTTSLIVSILAGSLGIDRFIIGDKTSNTSPMPFIKNEELILIKAEAHAQLNQTTDAVAAINIIRNAANIGNYGGATTQAALINEILYQRRYSLWAEPWGHRWIDARRYDRLNTIPTSFDQGTIFKQFPRPQSEINWDLYTGG